MKKCLLLFTMLAFGFYGYSQPAAKNGETDGPIMNVVESSHNFGQISQGTPVSFEFEFTNTGTQPLLILDVKTSCQCTASGYSKEPVKPGETSKIKATYSAAHAGSFSKTITVTTNQKENNTIFLLIKGEVIANIN